MDDRHPSGPERPRERGFFDRAADEVRTWLGDDRAEHRRERDSRQYGSGYGPETRTNQDRASKLQGGPTPTHRDDYRGREWGGGARRVEPSYHGQQTGPSQEDLTRGYGADQSYGDFGRTENGYRDYQAAYGNSHPGAERGDQSHHDEGYRRWRAQQVRQMDEDYAAYCRERQSQFETDFGSWRGSRQQGGAMSGSSGGSGLASSSGATLRGSGGPTGQSGDSARTRGTAGATTHALGQDGAGATTAAQGTASAATASTGSSGPLIGHAEDADQTSSSSTSRKANTTS